MHAQAKNAGDAEKYTWMLANRAKGMPRAPASPRSATPSSSTPRSSLSGYSTPRGGHGYGSGSNGYGSPRLLHALETMGPAPPRPIDRRPKKVEIVAAPAPEEAAPVVEAVKKAPVVLDENRMMDMMTDKIHIQFDNIKKAFRHIDIDNSGKLGASEIRKAFRMWNMEIDDDHLEDLIRRADADGDGVINYDEFVDHFCRETVQEAAKGKRGMTSLEAMGVDAYALLDEQLGHKKINNYKIPGFGT